MSASVKDGASLPKQKGGQHEAQDTVTSSPSGANYRGFVAGIFSGIAKLSVGYAVEYQDRDICGLIVE
jgi:solute carrier family 25 carnitine/acylcarnitine transporter 20/29